MSTMFESSKFRSLTLRDADREPAIWIPCPSCWGQRRIFEDRNGDGLTPCTCPGCLGLGEQIAGPRAHP
jgi:hypothetical protein